MQIVDQRADLSDAGQAVAILCPIMDGELAQLGARHLGVELNSGPHLGRRPSLAVTADQVDLTLMISTPERTQEALRIITGGSGMLLIGGTRALELARGALVGNSGKNWAGLIGVILAVARHGDEALSDLDEQAQDIADAAVGYTSAVERREMARLRADLFRAAEIQSAQENLVSDAEELVETLGSDYERALARAARTFAGNHATAMRVYAMMGDVLNEQDAVISERLTLVATIFLPLTLATGFFGMNFDWMTDRIGSLWAFVALGIAVPSVIAVATLLIIRRMTR